MTFINYINGKALQWTEKYNSTYFQLVIFKTYFGYSKLIGNPNVTIENAVCTHFYENSVRIGF